MLFLQEEAEQQRLPQGEGDPPQHGGQAPPARPRGRRAALVPASNPTSAATS